MINLAVTTKQEFVKTFLPPTVQNISFAQIDMDISDLSLADILRNVNVTFPKNGRDRNAIASGHFAVGILCKTELLEPLNGLLLIVTGNDTDIEIISRNYVVIAVQEDRITNDDSIKEIIDSITKYIITTFKDCIERFDEFYVKFVYDEYEMESSDEENYDDIYSRYF